MLDALIEIWRREPAAVTAGVTALVQLAAAFGLPVTAEQQAALNAVLIVVAGQVIRARVTPWNPGLPQQEPHADD